MTKQVLVIFNMQTQYSYPLCLEFHYSSYFTLYDLYHRLIKTTLKSQCFARSIVVLILFGQIRIAYEPFR